MAMRARHSVSDERMNGDEHCSLYIETLFDGDFAVAGFRLWIFDTSVHKTRIDLLTRGMRESLQESGMLQQQIQTKMEQFQRSLGTGTGQKRQQNQKTCEVTQRYRFTQYATVKSSTCRWCATTSWAIR